MAMTKYVNPKIMKALQDEIMRQVAKTSRFPELYAINPNELPTSDKTGEKA